MSADKKGKPATNLKESKKKAAKAQDNIYIVEKLVDKREHKHWKLGTIIQYKVSWEKRIVKDEVVPAMHLYDTDVDREAAMVKWEGYPDHESTWEPEWNISEVMKHAYNTHGIFDYVADAPVNEEDIDKDAHALTLANGTVLQSCALPSCRNIECVPAEFFACAGCITGDDTMSGAADSAANNIVSVSKEVAKQRIERITKYCSLACQRDDWARHQKQCMPTSAATGSTEHNNGQLPGSLASSDKGIVADSPTTATVYGAPRTTPKVAEVEVSNSYKRTEDEDTDNDETTSLNAGTRVKKRRVRANVGGSTSGTAE